MLCVKQVAERLSVSQSLVRSLLATGDLPYFKIRGSVRVAEDDLKRYLESTKRERGKVSATRQPPRPQLRHLTLD